MLSREERILSEILLARGLVERERIEECAKLSGSLADLLIEAGDLPRGEGEQAVLEARSLDAALAPELPAGKTLGEFRLVREIGRGGMGIVYEAQQEALGRHVALKILPAGAALDERLAIRFLREARAAGRLCHPGIVAVYTSGQTEGVLYFAMELIEGRTLAAAIAEGTLAPREAARIAEHVARALDYAHAHGLVHRDVKPENILLARDGRTLITDFGLVHEAIAGGVTLSRHVLGTPAFVAPEQVRGESPDPRGDIYGLGAVLYAMLSGRAPYTGELPSLVLARALTEPPPDLAALRPGLPRRLVEICAHAMARRPEERPASAALLADDLARFLAEPAVPERSIAPRRIAVAALFVVGALTTLAYFALRRSADIASGAVASKLVSFERIVDLPGTKRSPSFSPDGRSLIYTSDVAGKWDIDLVDLTGGSPLNLTAETAGTYQSPAFSPDGRSIAFVSLGQPGAIHVMELDSRALRTVLPGNVSGLAWSADGKEILFTDTITDAPGTYAAKTKLFAVEVATGRSRALTGIYGAQLHVSPSAGHIAFIAQGGGRTDIWTILHGAGDALRVTDDEALEWSPVWSAAGTEIFFGSDRGGAGRLYRIPVDGGGRPTGDPEPVSDAVFPAPFYLASGGAVPRELALVSVAHAGRLHRLLLGPGREPAIERVVALPNRYMAAVAPELSPSGSELVFTAVTSQEDLAVGGTEGLEPRLLTDDAFRDLAPRWSPDGSVIAFQSDRSGKMEIWTIRPDGTDLVQRTRTEGQAVRPVWSPDGKQLAFTVEGQGGFLTTDAPEPLPAIDGAPFEPWSWSADGRMLAGCSRGIVVYSLEDHALRRLTDFGTAPAWLDERRIVFATEREIHVVDSRSGRGQLLASFVPSRLLPSLGVAADGRSIDLSLAASAEELWRVAFRE